MSFTYVYMWTNFCDGHVEVEYIPAHTGHALYHKSELQKLPLPASKGRSGNETKPWSS